MLRVVLCRSAAACVALFSLLACNCGSAVGDATESSANKPMPRSAHSADRTTTISPIVLGYYYRSGKHSLTPAQINYRQFTHLCHAFVTTDSSGTLKMAGGVPDDELTSRAHAAGVKVLLSLGGADSGKYFDPLLHDRAATDHFIEGVVAIVLKHGYDGVDIDWEYPKETHGRDGFTYLATQFRKRLDAQKPGTLVTAALGSSGTCRWVDLEAVANVIDFVNIMTYDIHGPWDNHCGFNAPFDFDPGDREACRAFTVKETMAYWNEIKKWPKGRLLVGIPSYGRGFVADKWFDPINKEDKLDVGPLSFKNIVNLLADGWVRHWNDKAGVPWLSKPGVKGLISYDDPQSVVERARWASKNGYGGVFFWEISQDYVGGNHVLVKAATEGFNQ